MHLPQKHLSLLELAQSPCRQTRRNQEDVDHPAALRVRVGGTAGAFVPLVPNTYQIQEPRNFVKGRVMEG